MFVPGKRVAGHYRLGHLIAEGGFAEVYLASSAYQSVAIKRLKPEFAANHDLLKCFKEEARLLISFKHPNLISGIDYIEQEGEYLIIMEHVAGREIGLFYPGLFRAASRFRAQVALMIGILLCEALIYLHETLYLIHGDISPQNIMLSLDGNIKLIDFGSTVVSGAPWNKSSPLCGNISYLAPELANGYELSPQSDIYSLALVLSEIIGIQNRQDFIFIEINKLLRVFKKASNNNRQERYKSARELLNAFNEIALTLNFGSSLIILKRLWE